MTAPRLVFSIGAASGSAAEQEVTAFTGATYKRSLYAGPTLSCGLPGLSPAGRLLSGLASDVWLYKAGALWDRLRVMPLGQVWTDSGSDDVSLAAVGYRQVVEARHIISGPPTYTATDQGSIVWGLVQHTQAQTGGNLGITAGTIATGVVRDRTDYKIGDNLGKLLGDLGKVQNGPWWGIDASKVLTARLFTAFSTRTDPIVLGQNARRAERKPVSPGFANAAGAAGSATATVPVWVADAGIGTDVRGRWEAYDSSHSSITVQATVTEYANGLLANRFHPPYAWTFEIDAAAYFENGSNYDVGEFVPVVVPRSAVDEVATPALTATVQITEVTLAWDDAGTITVSLSAVEV